MIRPSFNIPAVIVLRVALLRMVRGPCRLQHVGFLGFPSSAVLDCVCRRLDGSGAATPSVSFVVRIPPRQAVGTFTLKRGKEGRRLALDHRHIYLFASGDGSPHLEPRAHGSRAVMVTKAPAET